MRGRLDKINNVFDSSLFAVRVCVRSLRARSPHHQRSLRLQRRSTRTTLRRVQGPPHCRAPTPATRKPESAVCAYLSAGWLDVKHTTLSRLTLEIFQKSFEGEVKVSLHRACVRGVLRDLGGGGVWYSFAAAWFYGAALWHAALPVQLCSSSPLAASVFSFLFFFPFFFQNVTVKRERISEEGVGALMP